MELAISLRSEIFPAKLREIRKLFVVPDLNKAPATDDHFNGIIRRLPKVWDMEHLPYISNDEGLQDDIMKALQDVWKGAILAINDTFAKSLVANSGIGLMLCSINLQIRKR